MESKIGGDMKLNILGCVRFFALIVSFLMVAGCKNLAPLDFGKTVAERNAGYSYNPVEPSSVAIKCISPGGAKISCSKVSKSSLLNALPDNSVRIATRRVSGKAGFGVPSLGGDIGVEGNSYEVIIDFVNTQTVNKEFSGKWFVNVPDDVKVSPNRCYPFERSVLENNPLDRYENWTLRAEFKSKIQEFVLKEDFRSEREEIRLTCGKNADYFGKKSGQIIQATDIRITPDDFNIPVYIGIGLRLTARVDVKKGNVDLANLTALTAAVEAGKASGRMSVQSIGISGKAARTNLLLLDKIDSTTIQNAIQILASIKASIESKDTTITPRVVGFHNTIGAGSQGVNLLHSLISSENNTEIVIDPASYAIGTASEDSDTK